MCHFIPCQFMLTRAPLPIVQYTNWTGLEGARQPYHPADQKDYQSFIRTKFEWFATKRDSLSAAKICQLIDENPDFKGIVFIGQGHLESRTLFNKAMMSSITPLRRRLPISRLTSWTNILAERTSPLSPSSITGRVSLQNTSMNPALRIPRQIFTSIQCRDLPWLGQRIS